MRVKMMLFILILLIHRLLFQTYFPYISNSNIMYVIMTLYYNSQYKIL